MIDVASVDAVNGANYIANDDVTIDNAGRGVYMDGLVVDDEDDGYSCTYA